MELKMNTKQVLNLLLIFCWIIFVGLCIEAGAFITNAVFAIINPAIIPRLWQQVDLSELYKYNYGYFFVLTLIVGIVSVIKAWLFFLMIKTLHNKNLNVHQPFNKELRHFVFYLSYLALGIGLFSAYGIKYSAWIGAQGVKMPDSQDLRIGGADVWLFMAVILFVIAHIFKRGIEIQTENELTI